MDRLIPRHRRKAGSGPPASALIAWIGTDPYLREAAATASYRREIALPLPSNTRSAKMAAVICSMLACGAVLGITEIISHGRGTVAQSEIATSAQRTEPQSITTSPADMHVDQLPHSQTGSARGHACSGTVPASSPSEAPRRIEPVPAPQEQRCCQAP